MIQHHFQTYFPAECHDLDINFDPKITDAVNRTHPVLPDIRFEGNILILGCGAVSRCLHPLLLRHVSMSPTKHLTLVDKLDVRQNIRDTLDAGARFVQEFVTDENMDVFLSTYLSHGDMLIDLSTGMLSLSTIDWCQRHGVIYVNSSLESPDQESLDLDSVARDTIYERYFTLRQRSKSWKADGPTAIVEHGANPGLASHWTKQGLVDIAHTLLERPIHRDRKTVIEDALHNGDFAALSMVLGVRAIHISERDTQRTWHKRSTSQFSSTWSPEAFFYESMCLSEFAWGTHESSLPMNAITFDYGPGNLICLRERGMNTLMRSWVPSGDLTGMMIPHGETYSISEHLSVYEGDDLLYRPTVCFVYRPSEEAVGSLVSAALNGYKQTGEFTLMNEDIVTGMDEVGVLLLGHDLGAWWVGSRLTVEQARELVPGQNATTLQVASSLLAAIAWAVENPASGLRLPDELPHEQILQIASPYLGETLSLRADWNLMEVDNGIPDSDSCRLQRFRLPNKSFGIMRKRPPGSPGAVA